MNVYRSHDTWKDTAAHVMTAVQFPRPVLSYSFLPPLTQQPLLLGKSSIRSPKQIKTIRVIPCMILSHSLSLWYGTVVLCFLLLNGLAVFVDGLKFSGGWVCFQFSALSLPPPVPRNGTSGANAKKREKNEVQ